MYYNSALSSNPRTRPTIATITQSIRQICDRLRCLSTQDLIEDWSIQFDAAVTPPIQGDFEGVGECDDVDADPRIELDDRRYALWPRGRVVAWFTTSITIPDALQGYTTAGKTLRLALRWWAEDAQIFVNGVKVLTGDLYDCFGRVVLAKAATPGETIDLAIRLVSPGHDVGALVTSVLQYESDYTVGCLDPAFVADELAVVVARLCPNVDAIETHTPNAEDETNHPNDQTEPSFDLSPELGDRLHHLATLLEPFHQLLDDRDRANSASASKMDRDFHAFTTAIDQQLQQIHPAIARDFPRDALTINLLTHAHLDMAWLWPLAETYDAAQRTFDSVLSLQADYPETIYTHSSPALYAWIEQHRPDLFTQIQTQVQRDRWDVAAGMWVEPELNIISGESIARQILYGQRYCAAKFGQISRVAWLPDSFGFCWQLPQFFSQGGIDYFVTQKLRWNDTTEFPYELFDWQAPDGTTIPAWMASPIGTDIAPVEMTRYAAQWQTQTDRDTALWLPGAGDHGGGPTRDMLDRVQRWQTSPVFPEMQFQSSAAFLDTVTQNGQAEDLPVWSSELYLELHRGCYTTYASQKRANRTCEILLYQAELYASIATLYAEADYPAADLEATWKRVLLNQFHDILPGSAIPEVFADADRDWVIAENTARSMRDTALQAIATHLGSNSVSLVEPLASSDHDRGVEILVFNPVLGQRSELIALDCLDLTNAQAHTVIDDRGTPIATQQNGSNLYFSALDLPSLGVKRYWLQPLQSSESRTTDDPASPLPERPAIDRPWILENSYLRVEIDSQTGDIARCFDRRNQRELLASSGGNRLEAYRDQGQYWDAWNIDPDYEQHPIAPPVLESIQWIERGLELGLLRSQLRVTRRLNDSRFVQDYKLDRDSLILEIESVVDWRERHTVVKAAFDLAFSADRAVYETPCGAIERPIRPQTEAERAQWEVPMLQWCDLSCDLDDDVDKIGNSTYGVSLLNDCKYGGDATPDRLRLTLLRGSTWPDPQADLGEHRFRYALYPHAGTWQMAETVRRAIAFNQPPIVMSPSRNPSAGQRATPYEAKPNETHLPLDSAWLDLGSNNLVLMALKRSEDAEGVNNSDRWLLRCYESAGEPAQLELSGALGLCPIERVDLLERPQGDAPDQLEPWRITSLAVDCITSMRETNSN